MQKKVKAKKHLGQHFLKDASVCDKMANALALDSTSNILEIGPGMGILTKSLLDRSKTVTAIEIDDESVEYLQINFPLLKVINKDFLKLDIQTVFQEDFVLAGNFPYNISSQIVFKMLDLKSVIPEMVGMFQKEVAERICAPHGSKTYGILSVLVQSYYDATYKFTIDENAFNPPPKVKSGIIYLKRKDPKECFEDYEMLKKVVKTAFNQRRKTLRNTLKNIFPNVDNIPNNFLTLRPEQITVQQYSEIAISLGRK